MTQNFDFSSIVIKKIFAINDINIDVLDKTFFRNKRPCYALAFKLVGKTIYLNANQSFVSSPQTMIFLSKNISYRWICKELGECIMIEFDVDLPKEYFKICSFNIDPKKQIIVDNLLNKLKFVWQRKKSNYYLTAMSIVYELLSIFDELIKKENYFPKSVISLIKPALEYMQNNLDDKNISNTSLAKLCDISVVYFRKTFVKIFATSPMKYLKIMRIKKAKELLLSDYSSIASVAEMTGFSSIYIFSKAFKNETGVSPTDFVKTSLIN